MLQASKGSSARSPAAALTRAHVLQDRIARVPSTGQCTREDNKAVDRPHAIVKSCLSSETDLWLPYKYDAKRVPSVA